MRVPFELSIYFCVLRCAAPGGLPLLKSVDNDSLLGACEKFVEKEEEAEWKATAKRKKAYAKLASKMESNSKKAARLRRQAQKKRAKGKKVVLKQPKLKHARVPLALMSEVAETRDADEKIDDFFAHMDAASQYILRIDKNAIGMATALKEIAMYMAASGSPWGRF